MNPKWKKNARRRPKVGARWRKRGMMAKLARQNKYPAVHRFKEWTQLQYNIYSDPNTAGGGILTFSANMLTNWANLRGLFDLYKITGIKLKLVPNWSVGQIGQSEQTGGTPDHTHPWVIPNLYIAPNRSPNVPAPASVADILNDDYVKIIRLTKPVNLYLKNPKCNITTIPGDGSAPQSLVEQFNSSLNMLQPWLATGGNSQTVDQSALKHYGFRYWIESNGAQLQAVQIFVKFYISLKEQD